MEIIIPKPRNLIRHIMQPTLDTWCHFVVPLLMDIKKETMNTKQRKILALIFKNPVQSNVKWKDIETLFEGFGGNITEGNGSRVRIELHGVNAVFHRPHPQKETDKGALMSVRRFLINAGINHDEI